MGGAAHGHPPLTSGQALDEAEVSRVVALATAEAERRRRSPRVNALTSLGAACLGVAPLLPGASILVGNAPPVAVAVVVLVAWVLFQLAALAFHVKGPEHPLYLVLSALDQCGQSSALLWMLYASGNAASPLWFLVLLRSYFWMPRTPWQTRVTLLSQWLPMLCVLVAFLATRRTADAAMTVLALLTSAAASTMTAGTTARIARVRAERDVLEQQLRAATAQRDRERIARELHDGVGADVMALILRLRRKAGNNAHPQAAERMRRAQRILDELRAVVWSLRHQQGTLAELAKLVDATCRRHTESVEYRRTMAPGCEDVHIGPHAALTALTAARELVGAAAAREGVRRVTVAISAASQMELRVEDDGPVLTSAAWEAMHDALRAALRTVAGRLEVAANDEGPGMRVQAIIPLATQEVPSNTALEASPG